MKKLLVTIMVLTLLLSGCRKKEADPIDDNYRVFYEIFVGSFSDSDNDGIGDLGGIVKRLDYLNDGDVNSGKSLGVQGLWLTPIFDSPSYHKYDARDYYSIDSQFGTMDDLKKLVEECHKRNVLVILDLAINHSSLQNEWFQKFRDARVNERTDDPYYDFYTCVDAEGRTGGHTWYEIPGTKWYYEGNFSSEMPEFNYDLPAVREEMVNIAKFYLDLGVDGFRFDAAKYIYYLDNEKSVDFWSWYIGKLKEIKPDIYTVGEVWSGDGEILQFTKALNCFSFASAMPEGYIASAAKSGNVNVFANYVEQYLNKAHEQNAEAMYIPFIANHDTDRASGYLTVNAKDAYMAANLYLLCSGSPFIYYGEEIGLKGSRGSANTDANRRLAMLWGDGDTVQDPEGTTYDPDKQSNGTVADQLKDKDSLLNYYEKVIAFRNRYPQIARGEYAMYYLPDSPMGGFIITYEGEDSYLFHNTTTEPLSVDIGNNEYKPSSVVGTIGQGSAKYENGVLTIDGQTSVLLK